ncbi:hypothetical protein HY250_04540 [Candidatus Azambacteria bacterium]|nr:hypothetical protein [Candidatus Azambacteria bacterium]MBI3685646.1 hypothetical protein [Candidatus Azambacteria bacterium]
MKYGTVIKKYTRGSERSKEAALSLFSAKYLIQIGLALMLLLSFLYIAETNAVMFSQRRIPEKEVAIFQGEQGLTKLEIAAAQLQSARQVEEVAKAHDMIFTSGVTYVSLNDTPVAFAR